MKKNLLFIIPSLFLLTACGGSSEDLFGVWERQGTYVNGQLEHEASATLEITADRYVSSTKFCTTSGSSVVDGNVLSVTMSDSDCPSPLLLPFTIDYTYELSEDGSQLSLTAQKVKEVYVKSE